MIFSELYKSSKSKLRHSQHQPPLVVPSAQPTQYDADLVSRDKTKQKDAVKRYLAEKIRNDWDFQWPPVAAAPAPAAAAACPTPAPPAPPAEATAPDTAAADPPPLVEARVVLTSEVIDPDRIPVSGAQSSAETAVPSAANPAAAETTLLDPAAGTADPRAGEPIDSGAEADSDSESVYSVVSEDPSRYRPRAEWTSELSDDEGPTVSPSPFRFDTPDSVGAVVQASAHARRTKRRRAARDEMSWNEGLACFNARRDAWTGARTVRLKPKPPVSPRSPTSPRRSLWRFRSRDGSHGQSEAVVLASPTATTATSPGTATATSTLPLSPTSPAVSTLAHTNLHLHHTTGGIETITPPTSDGDSHTSKSPATTFGAPGVTPQQGAAAASSSAAAPTSPLASTYPVETVIPIPAPLLPPANAMRASITPAIYLSIYDKVVMNSLQPSCPINLVDMMRSCVAGWKRDGEWPPRPTMAAPILDFASTAAVAAGGGPFVSSSATAAVRSRRRREREEEQARRAKERRDSAATSGGSPVARRMSFAGLIGRVSSNGGGSGGGNEGGGGGNGAEEPSSPKSIRKSIQRVLGLGQNGHGHGHSQSMSSVGSPPPTNITAQQG